MPHPLCYTYSFLASKAIAINFIISRPQSESCPEHIRVRVIPTINENNEAAVAENCLIILTHFVDAASAWFHIATWFMAAAPVDTRARIRAINALAGRVPNNLSCH
mgnify:CR=1 FL=1